MLSRAVVGVSLKAYLGMQQTEDWLRSVRGRLTGSPVELFVIPSYLAVPMAVQLLSGTGIGVGGQDICAHPAGPWTGDVTASMLRETGASYAEVGHSERRRLHGESDDMVAAKLARSVEEGLMPVLCVGEQEPLPVTDACRAVSTQLTARLSQAPAGSEIMVAYEPEWAIGADTPAPPDYVVAVVSALRATATELRMNARVLYGGSTDQGYFSATRHEHNTSGWPDGLFVGRAALDVDRLAGIVAEVGRVGAPTSHGGIR